MVVATVVLRKPHRAAAKDGPVTMGGEAMAFMMLDLRGGESGTARVQDVDCNRLGGCAGSHSLSRND